MQYYCSISSSSLLRRFITLVLHDELERLREEKKAENLTELTKDLHFYPDLHGTRHRNIKTLPVRSRSPHILPGNRSPLADSRMTGSIVGLQLVRASATIPRENHADALGAKCTGLRSHRPCAEVQRDHGGDRAARRIDLRWCSVLHLLWPGRGHERW